MFWKTFIYFWFICAFSFWR